MYIRDIIKSGCSGLLTAVLLACGGGGGGQVAGIGGTGITASGTITGFGSIFVNGVEFETGTSAITVDGSPGSESDLGLGMVVTVTGTVNEDGITGTADSVVFDDEVQGPIENEPVDPTADPDGLNGDGNRLRFTVLGITVEADRTATVFDGGAGFASLAQNDYIEVSGFFDQDGVLHATRIEGKGGYQEGISEVELKGIAQNADADLKTFELASFQVDYLLLDPGSLQVTGGIVTEGMRVEVKGTLTGSDITPTQIEEEHDSFGENVDKVSIEGILTDYIGIDSFRVSGVQVDASAADAVFMPASLRQDLIDGVGVEGLEIEVDGPIVGGVLHAVRVEVRGGEIELEAQAWSASVPDSTITLQYHGALVTVQVDSQTSLRDEAGEDEYLSLAEIGSTDFLEIHAALDDDGHIVASEVHRVWMAGDPADETGDDILQGPADSCDASGVTIFGVDFVLNGDTSFQDENEDTVTDATAFCNAVDTSGLYVKVQDNHPADGIADEAELED